MSEFKSLQIQTKILFYKSQKAAVTGTCFDDLYGLPQFFLLQKLHLYLLLRINLWSRNEQTSVTTALWMWTWILNFLNVKPITWSNTLKQFVGCCRRFFFSVFDDFVRLTLNGLICVTTLSFFRFAVLMGVLNAKSSEKLTFLTPWYVHVRACIRG